MRIPREQETAMTDQGTTGNPAPSAPAPHPPKATRPTILASGPLMSWRGVGLITAAMLAAAFAVLLSGVLQGLGVELALALIRHRRFGVIVAVLGGVLAAAFEIVFYEWYSYVADYSMAWKVIYLGCGMVSGAAVAGVGGWALVRGLAGTGALNAFPPGQEIRESHPV